MARDAPPAAPPAPAPPSPGGEGRALKSIIAAMGWKGIGMALSLVIAVGLANLFGAGAASDAYFFARRVITNVSMALERLFHLFQVPPLVRLAQAEGLGALASRLRTRSWQIFGVSVVAVILIWVFARPIVAVLAPGFGDGQADMAAGFLRILALVFPIAAVTAMSGAALNALRLFSLPLVARLFPRIFVVLALGLAAAGIGAELTGVAWALVLGTVVMGAMFFLLVRRSIGGASGPPSVSAAPLPPAEGSHRRRLLAMFISNLHLVGAAWVDMAFASTTGTGALATLEFAERLINITPGVVTNSVVLVYFTDMADALARGDRDSYRRNVAVSIRTTLFMVLPLALGMLVIAEPLVDLVLAHGAFTAEDAMRTTMLVSLLVPLLPINALLGCLTSGIFADTALHHLRIVVDALIVAMAVRVGVNLLLIDELGVLSVPIASLCGMGALLAILYWRLSARVGGLIRGRETREIGAVTLASGLSGLAMWGVSAATQAMDDGIFVEAARLLSIGGAGGLTLIVAAQALGIEEVRLVTGKLARLLRRRRS